MSPEEPSFLLSAKLYEKYQIFVHNESAEECNVETYCEFLVDTPLEVNIPRALGRLRAAGYNGFYFYSTRVHPTVRLVGTDHSISSTGWMINSSQSVLSIYYRDVSVRFISFTIPTIGI